MKINAYLCIMNHELTEWLPTTRREMEQRGWDRADVILFSGDAYVDHPSFGVAVIGRILEAEGLRVAIVPQPDWHGDLRDFKRLGRPRLWFGISPGCMDSMVNKYTAARRLRSEDAYSPDGRHDMRPEYPTIVYSQILRKLYPDVPIVLGGIEASLRRLTHYDYWQDKFLPSILLPSQADLIVYGMGEKPTIEIAHRLTQMIENYDPSLSYDEDGEACIGREAFRKTLLGDNQLPQTVAIYKGEKREVRSEKRNDIDTLNNSQGEDVSSSHFSLLTSHYKDNSLLLHSHEACLADPKKQAENFRHIEEESNKIHAQTLIQETEGQWVVVTPPYPPMTTEELDHSFDLPYTRLPHPKYKGKRIPAYEMIRHSVCLHRGCFGGCAFCTISAHQGKFIASRSKESILKEVEAVTRMPDFRGYISDLGGPSANMYRMGGKDKTLCEKCKRPSCIHPKVCPNLNGDHRPLIDIYRAVDQLPGVKKSFIGSGVRYDLLLHDYKDKQLNQAAHDYTQELITRHVSGRLKVAPEHTEPHILQLMRKPPFEQFRQFKAIFDRTCQRAGLRQQIIPYFISSHPGCHEEDMTRLADQVRDLGLHLEQVQDFTPTPMTVSTETWYTGYDPYTMEKVFSAHSQKEKLAQRAYFFWYKDDKHQQHRKKK